MDEEIAGPRVWRKAIPGARDRLQSRWLVGVVGSLLALLSLETLRMGFLFAVQPGKFLLNVLAVSVGFALLVLMLRAATPAGAVCGGMICLVVTWGTGSAAGSVLRSGLAPLAMLFVLPFLATRAGRRWMAGAGLAEGRKGRSAAQVIANLSTVALCVSAPGFELVMGGRACCGGGNYRHWVWPGMMVMGLAALVEATADTMSSEIGQAFGGRPVMLSTLRRVEVGTDGAVTLLGSAAGIVGGAAVAGVGMWALQLTAVQAGVVLLAGVCGLFFDSVLGATVERRGWLGNDLVNFSSTVFAAGVGLGMMAVLR